jgi:hypothetical protein
MMIFPHHLANNHAEKITLISLAVCLSGKSSASWPKHGSDVSRISASGLMAGNGLRKG